MGRVGGDRERFVWGKTHYTGSLTLVPLLPRSTAPWGPPFWRTGTALRATSGGNPIHTGTFFFCGPIHAGFASSPPGGGQARATMHGRRLGQTCRRRHSILNQSQKKTCGRKAARRSPLFFNIPHYPVLFVCCLLVVAGFLFCLLFWGGDSGPAGPKPRFLIVEVLPPCRLASAVGRGSARLFFPRAEIQGDGPRRHVRLQIQVVQLSVSDVGQGQGGKANPGCGQWEVRLPGKASFQTGRFRSELKGRPFLVGMLSLRCLLWSLAVLRWRGLKGMTG